jgi:hypothetical protein
VELYCAVFTNIRGYLFGYFKPIAKNVYGDSALWYLVADANGLSGNSDLTVGQALNIPSRVSSGSGANTFTQDYINTSQWAISMLGSATPYVAAAVGAAAGSAASQVAGMAMGMQKDFNWSSVAFAAAGAGLSAEFNRTVGASSAF